MGGFRSAGWPRPRRACEACRWRSARRPSRATRMRACSSRPATLVRGHPARRADGRPATPARRHARPADGRHATIASGSMTGARPAASPSPRSGCGPAARRGRRRRRRGAGLQLATVNAALTQRGMQLGVVNVVDDGRFRFGVNYAPGPAASSRRRELCKPRRRRVVRDQRHRQRHSRRRRLRDRRHADERRGQARRLPPTRRSGRRTSRARRPRARRSSRAGAYSQPGIGWRFP